MTLKKFASFNDQNTNAKTYMMLLAQYLPKFTNKVNQQIGP